MRGTYPCPVCGANDWDPQTWVDGPPVDKCNKCGYEFTLEDVPKAKLAKLLPKTKSLTITRDGDKLKVTLKKRPGHPNLPLFTKVAKVVVVLGGVYVSSGAGENSHFEVTVESMKDD